MAAETAVEITAQETVLTEDRQEKAGHSVLEEHSEKVPREEASEETVLEDRSERTASVLEGRSEKIQKEELLAETVREDLSVIIQREEASAATVREDRSEKTLSVQEGHSEITQREGASEEESLLRAAEADSTLQRRASTRRTSTISATRRKAESTR